MAFSRVAVCTALSAMVLFSVIFCSTALDTCNFASCVTWSAALPISNILLTLLSAADFRSVAVFTAFALLNSLLAMLTKLFNAEFESEYRAAFSVSIFLTATLLACSATLLTAFKVVLVVC